MILKVGKVELLNTQRYIAMIISSFTTEFLSAGHKADINLEMATAARPA